MCIVVEKFIPSDPAEQTKLHFGMCKILQTYEGFDFSRRYRSQAYWLCRAQFTGIEELKHGFFDSSDLLKENEKTYKNRLQLIHNLLLKINDLMANYLLNLSNNEVSLNASKDQTNTVSLKRNLSTALTLKLKINACLTYSVLMRIPTQLLLGVAAGLASAVGCFLAGVYFQHHHATRQLQELVQQDAYACYISSKIFAVFGFFSVPDNAQHRVQRIMKYGFPGLDDVRIYGDFVLSYDRRNRLAHWVCEHLQLATLQGTQRVSRRGATYRPDLSVPSHFRSTLADYKHSGFDRGHLAAAANHHEQQGHCEETFLLTNIAPQIGKGFNSGAWNKLEIYVRELTQIFGSVYVCTGPLFKPRSQGSSTWTVEYQMIGSSMVAVPTHFFKVIMVESKLALGKPYMEAYVLPNAVIPEEKPLRDFLCDIREIEHLAGLTFFQGIRRSAIFGSNYPSASQVFRDFA